MSDPDSGQRDPQLAAILGSLQQSVSATSQLAANVSSLQQTVTAIPQLVANLSSLQESIAALNEGQQDIRTSIADLSQGQRDLNQELQQQQQAIEQQQRAITAIAQGQGNHAAFIDNQSQPSLSPVSLQPSVQTIVHDAPCTIAHPIDQAVYEETQKGSPSKYDLSESGFDAFNETISEAAVRFGSSSTGALPIYYFRSADSDNPTSIFDNHSQVGIDCIKTQWGTFITGANRDRDSQQVQNNQFLVDYTLNSLTKEAKQYVLQHESTFSIDGVKVWALLWKYLVTMLSHDQELPSAPANEVGRLRDHQETTSPTKSFVDKKSKGKVHASSIPVVTNNKINSSPGTSKRQKTNEAQSWKTVPPDERELDSSTNHGWSNFRIASCEHPSKVCEPGKPSHARMQQDSFPATPSLPSPSTFNATAIVKHKQSFMAQPNRAICLIE